MHRHSPAWFRDALYLLPWLALACVPVRAMAAEQGSIEEVRNTVNDLIDSLVARGVVTPEQARALSRDAAPQSTAGEASGAFASPVAVAPAAPVAAAVAAPATRSATPAALPELERGAVRVTYVPQFVRDEITAQVRNEVTPLVVQDVSARAREEGWGVPAGLPDWIRGLRLSGDIRARGQFDLFSEDNAEFAYLDFLAINDAGGIARAGEDAYLNTTEDRSRLRMRARLGVEAALGEGFTAGLKLATGNFRDPVSTNQTLAQNGGRYTFGVDQAYLRYDLGETDDRLSLVFGRSANPFFSTDLLYDSDLTFHGIHGSYRMAIGSDAAATRDDVYLTLGAFPIEEVELSGDDKWLYAAQLGTTLAFAEGLRLNAALAYYHYDNIVGRRNPFDSTVFDYTAPEWLQKGNTLFDIRNDADPTTNLFALAADYQIVNLVVGFDMPVLDRYALSLIADYATNVGFDQDEVASRTGLAVRDRSDGYQLELLFGHPALDRRHAWRASLRYRYLERDAVLDAFTDSDFHLGGTDGRGYVLRGDYALGEHVYLSLRYLSANEIDGPPLGIDVVQIDLNGRF
jgi:hypothetical protein